jgi:hypothetical protein
MKNYLANLYIRKLHIQTTMKYHQKILVGKNTIDDIENWGRYIATETYLFMEV